MHNKNCNYKRHPFGKYHGMTRRMLQMRTNRRLRRTSKECSHSHINDWCAYVG